MTPTPGLLRRTVLRGRAIASFALWFTGEFLRANVVVVREIMTPGHGVAPAIVEVPLRCRTPLEIASMASLMTLTPGTLALSLHEDPPRLTLHGMHADDVDAFRRQIHDLEDRLLAALRPVGRDDPPTRDRSADRAAEDRDAGPEETP